MKVKAFLASNVVFCFVKAGINLLYAIVFFLLFDSPLQYLAIGLLAISSSFVGFIRGITKSDVWGTQMIDLFPALVYLISGLVLCFDESPKEQVSYISLTCFFMVEAFIGIMMANDVKYYDRFWGISIGGVLLALLLSFLSVPGYFFAYFSMPPLIIAFLALQGLILLRIGFIERKLEIEYKKTVKEIQEND